MTTQGKPEGLRYMTTQVRAGFDANGGGSESAQTRREGQAYLGRDTYSARRAITGSIRVARAAGM